MATQRPWHRLFGLSWMDFFRGLPVTVEMEKDLSLKTQWLDLVISRKDAATLACQLPDGFEDLSVHNLVTFKSFQEPLSCWTLQELVSHYVNYRKQVSPSQDDPLPESDFRLFGVCVRFPSGLDHQLPLIRIQQGVYEVRQLGLVFRIVVVQELPQAEHNAMLHLFSFRSEQFIYGAEHYRPRSSETSTLLLELFRRFPVEGQTMADLLEQFAREKIEELLKELPAEERLKGISAEERLKGIPAGERLKGLSSVELLAALPPEMREALARQLKDDESASGSN